MVMTSKELVEQVVAIPNKTAKLIKKKNKAIVEIYKNKNLYHCLVILFTSVYRARNFLSVVGIYKYEEEKEI